MNRSAREILKNQFGFSPIILLVLVVLVIGGALYFLLPKLQNNSGVQLPSSAKAKKIGVIQHTKGLDGVYTGFKKGLADLGYKEGQNVTYTYEFTGGEATTAAKIAKQYLNEDYDLILAITSIAAGQAIKESSMAGKLTPIVFTNANTLLPQGFIKSYQSSGNNATGLVPDDVAISVKKLEFLKQINPQAKTVAIFTSRRVPATTQTLDALAKEAPKLGLTIKEYVLKGNDPAGPLVVAQIKQMADAVAAGDIDAIMTIPDPVITDPNVYKVLEDLGERIKVPTMFLNLQDGGMLTYNLDVEASGVEAAGMANKIFNGTKPADIPIEFPKKNILILNLGIAKRIGVTIPDSLLSIADKKIE